jgi:two-component system response regulator AtoC
MSRTRVLVVDDDESTRRYLSTLLSAKGYDVAVASSGEQALRLASETPRPSVMVLDLLLPGLSGAEVLERMRQGQSPVPVVVLSTVAQLRSVVEAVKRGASDYLTKPFEEQELELAIQNAIEKQSLREEVQVLRRRLDGYAGADGFVSASPSMQRIREIARQVADTDAPVLLLGESGVGKEVVARFIHESSARRDRPFVRVNCAAIPQDLLESELFGYERGAFSGALRDKPGKFELAARGTILLDEIGEMSSALQAKLLHVLQDGEYGRLGGRSPLRADARVLASTNSRIDTTVAAGRFREDLYFRLNVIRIEIPPLRDRREDIALLARHFLRVYAERYRSAVDQLPAALMDAFLAHPWPGNVRELENAVRRFVILPDVSQALAELTRQGPDTGRAEEGPAAAPAPRVAESDVSLKRVAAAAAGEAERELVRRVLGETRWNRKEAARRLKVSYKALLNKLKKWELEKPGAPL